MKKSRIVLKPLHFYAVKSLKFLLFSDLHFNAGLKDDLLAEILKTAKKAKPNYILFAGDLVNLLDDVKSEAEESRLLSFLVRLSFVAPLFLCLGNHDYYRTNSKKQMTFRPKRLKSVLKGHKNIHLLINESYEDENVYIFGCALPPEYYHSQSPYLHGAVSENKAVLMNLLDSYGDFTKKKDKISFFLIHSPVFLKDQDVAEKLKNFNFTVSGHMHMGCVPPFLNKIWPSDRGIISPAKHFFPHQARSLKKDHNIILPAVRTITCSKILNSPFPPTLTILNTKK